MPTGTTVAKVAAWAVTTCISLVALWLAYPQHQQLADLQRTNPTARIDSITRQGTDLSDTATVTDVEDNPFVPQRIVDIRGAAHNVPDNGDLFIVLHSYGARQAGTKSDIQSKFFFTPANLTFGATVNDQQWIAPAVYIGEDRSPKEEASYRVSLYFCNSTDSGAIHRNISDLRARDKGLDSIPGSSCKQLDSIFVRRHAA